jgi:DnaK suppressor protein
MVRSVQGVLERCMYKEDQPMIGKNKATKRDRFLAKMYQYLTDTKTRLIGEIATQLRIERDNSRHECMDSCDLASEENAREMSTILSERERLKVGLIDDALRRMVSLKYGSCEVCGFDITEERLHVMLFTRLCCDCQQELEHHAKTRSRYVDQDCEGYKVGSIHAPEDSNRDPLRIPRNEPVLAMLQAEPGH